MTFVSDNDQMKMREMALQLKRAWDELRAALAYNATLKAHIAFLTLQAVEVEPMTPQPESINDGEWWLYGGNIYRPADMQQRLLEDSPADDTGGPLLVDGVWYWSPVWDEDYHLLGDT